MSNDRLGKWRSNWRAQSETVGFVLLFGMVLIGAGAVVSFGAVAINDSEDSLSADRAEKVMTQMDSEISMVALGRTDSQQIQFDRASGEEFSVDEDAGLINITKFNPEDGETDVVMDDVALGAITFERGDTTIAYQGGGVWRTDGAGSGMVSPPEFNYRDATLTLPLVTVSGDRTLSRGATIEKDGDSTTYFPTEEFSNPLEDDIVQVTVESDYHHGWRSYFETRTEGDVTHEPEHQRVSVNLTAPAIESFDDGAAVTGNSPPTTGPNGEIVGGTQTNVNAPSVSNTIEERVADCESNGCTEPADLEGTHTAGTYYFDSDPNPDDEITFDTSSGDIEVILDADLTISGGTNITVEGDGQVEFFVSASENTHDEININGNPEVNLDGDPEQMILYGHTELDEVSYSGDLQFNGFVYAPGSHHEIDGGGGQDENIVGGVVGESVNTGNGVITQSNPNNFLMELETDVNVLTFLHISTNPVTITSN